MKSISKLKDQARLHELNEDWEKAIGAYLQVLRMGEQWEAEADLALFNRIGDLYLRVGRPAEAVSYYEQAADKYAEAGLYNNAIALCNKALRYVPQHLELYRKLGQFSAFQGFHTDARRWFLEYAEQKFRAGDLDDAFSALSDFARLSEDPEVRELLGHKLQAHGRTEEAVEELTRAYVLRVRAGESDQAEAIRAELLEIDAAAADALDTALQEPPPTPDVPDGGVQADTAGLPGLSNIGLESAAGAAGLADEGAAESGVEVGEDLGLEPTALVTPEEEAALAAEAAGIDEDEDEDEYDGGYEEEDESEDVYEASAVLDDDEEESGPPLPLIAIDHEADARARLGAGLEPEDEAELEDEEEAPPLPLLGTDGFEDEPPGMAEPDRLADAEVGEAPSGAPAPTPMGPEPPDFAGAVAEARDSLARGERAAGLRALESLHAAYAQAGDLDHALDAVGELLRIDRDNVRAHQHAVEYAFRTADRRRMIDAYLALADCLRRLGERTKARVVYQSVLDLDPGNTTALEGVRSPSGPAVRAGEDYVDLASFLEPEEPPGEALTRFVVAEKTPTGDEERDFAELLSQFRAKVSQSVGEDDPASHYDLGLAFKEMGLLDEAIAEFQVALRGGQERLMVYEELGQCFMLKQQYNVALKVLQRALQLPHDADAELMGVYYHLGRCFEELGKRGEARDAYERVLGVDLRFRDVAERLARL